MPRTMRRLVVSATAVALMCLSASAATVTIPSTYDEATQQWVGDVVALTNAITTNATWTTFKLEKGVYDLSPLTNAPMSTSTYQGPSLLSLKVGTDLRGTTGNREDVVLKGPGHYRLAVYPGGCKFRHLTLEGGYAMSGCTVPNGGAVYPSGGSAAYFTNCLFRFNVAANYGGAVTGGADYWDCYFYGNVAGTGYGFGGATNGGRYYNCQIVSNACVISNSQGDWGQGGGLYGATIVSGCTVVSNFSTRSGGGLSNCSGITNCYIAFNAVKGVTTPKGAGLYTCSTITNCVVEYNVASSGYGGGMSDTSAVDSIFRFNGGSHYYHDMASATNVIERCELIGSDVQGLMVVDSCHIHHVSNVVDVLDNVTFGPCTRGVTYPFYNTREIRNSLIDHCWITNGANHAAFYSNGKIATRIENCTIADNTFTYTLRGYNNTTATVAFVNTVLARNRRGSTYYDLIGYESKHTYMTNCVLGVKSLTQAEGIENVDTQIMGAEWNPRFVESGEHPYAPKRTSILRDAGILSGWLGGETDLAGNPRVYDGKVDVGCYECCQDPVGSVFSVR